MTETTQVTRAELKPCPFCGGSKILVSQTIDQAAPNWYATCHRTTCAFTGYSSTEAEARAAWNTRTEALSSAAGEPVAWMYAPIKPLPNHDPYFVQQNRANMDPRFWTETPLYPAPSSQRALVEALEALVREASMLLQNAEGCAANHYGHDMEIHGMPQWLADSRFRITKARATLAALKETDNG